MLKFNTTGPCFPDEHDMLPALDRLPGVRELVAGGNYFVVHAPRQTDLGLLRVDRGALVPANPMCAEIIGRYLSRGEQVVSTSAWSFAARAMR